MKIEILLDKWRRKYDRYLKQADDIQDELEKLDIIKDWIKYQPKRQKMDALYFLTVHISEVIKDLESINK